RERPGGAAWPPRKVAGGMNEARPPVSLNAAVVAEMFENDTASLEVGMGSGRHPERAERSHEGIGAAVVGDGRLEAGPVMVDLAGADRRLAGADQHRLQAALADPDGVVVRRVAGLDLAHAYCPSVVEVDPANDGSCAP